MSVSGRAVLVTGASSGIGAALAREAAARGASQIILVARRADRLAALARELGPAARPHPCDLTDPDARDALIAAHPGVDVVANAAGFGARGAVASLDRHRLEALVALNCAALVSLSRAWLPRMQAQGFGGILNVGSMVGFIPVPTSAAYAASKAFVHSFTEALYVECLGSGVFVHLTAPGPVPTEFYEVSRGEKRAAPSPVALRAEQVAQQALDDLFRGKARRVPGLPVRAITYAAASLPAPLRRRLTRLLR